MLYAWNLYVLYGSIQKISRDFIWGRLYYYKIHSIYAAWHYQLTRVLSGSSAEISLSSFFLLFWVTCSFILFLAFSPSSNKIEVKTTVFSEIVLSSLFIYSFVISPISCALGLLFPSSFHGRMKRRNPVSLMPCFWTETRIKLFSSNLIAATNIKLAAFVFIHSSVTRIA